MSPTTGAVRPVPPTQEPPDSAHAWLLLAGGDFYDATPLPDGRLVAFVGDVMGRGVAAASAMAQVRSALRAYVFPDPLPGTVIERLTVPSSPPLGAGDYPRETMTARLRPGEALLAVRRAQVEP